MAISSVSQNTISSEDNWAAQQVSALQIMPPAPLANPETLDITSRVSTFAEPMASAQSRLSFEALSYTDAQADAVNARFIDDLKAGNPPSWGGDTLTQQALMAQTTQINAKQVDQFFKGEINFNQMVKSISLALTELTFSAFEPNNIGASGIQAQLYSV